MVIIVGTLCYIFIAFSFLGSIAYAAGVSRSVESINNSAKKYRARPLARSIIWNSVVVALGAAVGFIVGPITAALVATSMVVSSYIVMTHKIT